MSLLDLRDGIVRRIARSVILRLVDGHKTTIFRIVQGISMVITGAILAAGGVDEAAGTELGTVLDSVNANWVLLLNFLAQFGLEFALADKAAKEKGK